MGAKRFNTPVIKFLAALLIVLLIGFVPLRELLYPSQEEGTASLEPATDTLKLAEATSTAVNRLDTPTPVPEEAVVVTVKPLWIANPSDGAVLRIDPLANEITGRVELDGGIEAVASDENSVWIGVSAARDLSQVVRVDAERLNITAMIPIYSGRIHCMEVGAGAVWVGLERSPVDDSSGGSLARIDPMTNEINAILPRPGIPVEIAIYAQTLWMLEQQETGAAIGRMDAASLQITTFYDAQADQTSPPAWEHLALGAAGVWATARDDNSNLLYQLNPSDGSILAAVDLGEANGQPAALNASGAHVLVWMSNGALVRVDPLTQRVVSRAMVKAGQGKIHLRAETVWIENEREAEIYRIENQAVQATISSGSKPAPTPVPTPTLQPDEPPECDAYYPTRLEKGGKAMVTLDPPLPNRMRSEPAARAQIIGEIEPGEVVNLLDGPLCNGGWVWWYVQSRKSGLTGWTSEGDRHEYWLSPVE